MAINVTGEVRLSAPCELVWEKLFELETMRGVVGRVPGIALERLEQVDDDTYEMTATVSVAAVRGKYQGRVIVLERRAPEFVRVRGEGRGGGNLAQGEVTLTLFDRDGMTAMVYTGDGDLTGPLANLGQRLVDTVGRQFIEQGARIFAEEIEAQQVEAGALVLQAPAELAPTSSPLSIFTILAAVFVLLLTIVLYVTVVLRPGGP
jgi:carbon monoxide dehydrogenase subunit G